jgi:hypothetical protein
MPKGKKTHHGFLTIEYTCECGIKKNCKSEKEYENYVRLHSKYCKKAKVVDLVNTETVYGMVTKQHIMGQGKVV